jgi:spore coat polysaccharide biosynthesis protein SpsF (cytidylyltransferase family)
LQSGVVLFRGSSEDVLDRYYQAAKRESADVVVRVTGDCPFLDPVESEKVLRFFLEEKGCDYASNVDPPFLPDVLDTEVMSFSALQRAWQLARDVPDREHVTLFIRRHPNIFSVKSLHGDFDLSSHRWTIDERRDYEFLNAVAMRLAEKGQFGYLREIIDLMAEEPELLKINTDIRRNAGLEKSLLQNPLSD